jgi:hypothetical protein
VSWCFFAKVIIWKKCNFQFDRDYGGGGGGDDYSSMRRVFFNFTSLFTSKGVI